MKYNTQQSEELEWGEVSDGNGGRCECGVTSGSLGVGKSDFA